MHTGREHGNFMGLFFFLKKDSTLKINNELNSLEFVGRYKCVEMAVKNKYEHFHLLKE